MVTPNIKGTQMNKTIHTIILSAVMLCTCCNIVLGISLWELRIYENKEIPATERLQIIYGLLLREATAPTDDHKGAGGGIINHDYTLAQIIGVLEYIARESAESQAMLEIMVKAEQNPEVKEAASVALAISGSREVEWEKLAAILRSSNRVFLREKTAYALSKARPSISIPCLIEALHDSGEVVSGGDVGSTVVNIFPVRQAAAYGLKEIGISVTATKESSFEYDRESAIKALMPELSSGDEWAERQALLTVGQIGGESARQVIENFIVKNANANIKSNLVSEAQGILRNLK